MPYSNVPKPLWGKMERCVAAAKGKGVKNPYAVCYSSIVGKGIADAAKRKQKRKKGG
jgi:hypothetical protein